MRIVVSHLTRMKGARICVAGVDVETLTHVRPVTPAYDPITRDLLRESGGPFGVGAVVDIGAPIPQPDPPETEDCRFQTRDARLVETLSPERYWETLSAIQVDGFEEAFGPELERRGRSYAIEAGHGTRSLAVIPVRRPRLQIDRWGKLRLSPRSTGLSLGVNDIRFYEADHETIRQDVVSNVDARLRASVEAHALLGLTRAFQAKDDDRERHWLQVNGLCLADNPTGDTP